MFSPEMDYLVNKERQKDRLREIERQRLIRVAGLQQSGHNVWVGKVADWIKTRLMRWGSKLQRHDPVHRQALYRQQ